MTRRAGIKFTGIGLAFLSLSVTGQPVHGAEQELTHSVAEIAYGLDTLYLLLSGAMVMWMAAGFSMLECGLVRSKNVVEILTKNITLFAIASIACLLVGYNIMYGDGGSILPSFSFLVGGDHSPADISLGGENHYSRIADFFFQVVFVATAMSVVSGAIAERMKLWAFLLFAVVMCSAIYPVQGYWKWGGGFLDHLGFLDFAGSGVVHLCGASAALAGVLLLGPRLGKYKNGRIKAIPGSNLPLASLGTFILWFGWFGFNGGSQLRISTVSDANAVAMAFANTNMAAAGGLLAALILSRIWFGKADLTMALNGALAGLVAITAEPVTPSLLTATGVGAVAGILVVISIILLDKAHIDDPVGAISVHGVSGIWGLLAVTITNPEASLIAQLIGITTIFSWVFITSIITWFAIKKVMGLRISPEEEHEGVDLCECGLTAYPEFTKD
ncbi:ammonium transporter [Desulfotalea psychrophila]|uniref:Ammonium transporter n=1 Tax=Desulfotalea psychrophila (strain LSv54 / DSM 12343) TaxID=177439 RepID=Q6ARH0_DESPS|nr:ammonium transporter [Desulfotalea psychrophila]CAG35055.1 probable ammonium transporter [Desulfotalea psychrophila LSv54]